MIFSPAEKNLSLAISQDETVELSNQACRLLVIFLQSSGEVLERDFLLENGWERFGYKSSNNSLGVAVSELRKKFEMFGISPQIITTIPRIGFSFHADVEVIQEEDNHDSSMDMADSTAPSEESSGSNDIEISAEADVKVPSKKNITTRTVKMAFAFLAIISGLLYVIFNSPVTNSIPLTQTNEIFLFKENDCNVFALENRKKHSNDSLVDLVKKDLKDNEIKCTKGGGNIYHSRVFEDNGASSYSFIALCTIRDDLHASHCKTVIN